ncbi:LacI family DNA-binding transcriptional regulator [Variovorax sp. OV329]|uniref:LacI family DNA-binding transcriptional regulator n=1 Tax=Variovorax sp. OV329 TaxID=1882825 RepID=UPI0008F1EF04|nr:LacI family DNA-binding transcriptional regulator [Variovorax sp. OV329]SFN52390.1 transcriptional regulator, LacI family [Variovorax sp. OV329]
MGRVKRDAEGAVPPVPTMADVARAAQVSVMTVSRVLRGAMYVDEGTGEKVKAAAAKLGYVPNRLAGSLSSRSTAIVAAIVPTIANSLFADTVQGLSDELGRRGIQLMLGCSAYDPELENSLISTTVSWRPAGIVAVPVRENRAELALLPARGVPVIEVWDIDSKPVDACVGYSNFQAAYAMTRHLHEQGYRRIAFVRSSRTGDIRTANRSRGYATAVEEFELAPGLHFEIDYPLATSGGVIAMRWLLERKLGLDAVFFSNDIVAIGALYECRRRRIAVPRNLAIAGFGDFDEASVCVPALTTVRVPRYEIGRRAAEMLVARLDGKSTRSRRVDLGFELVRRESA